VNVLIRKDKLITAYKLMLFSINLTLILLTYVEGYRSGIFLFFFTTTISFALLTDTQIRNYALKASYVSIASFLTAILISSSHSHLQTIAESDYRGNLVINIVISFAVVVWMAYSLSLEHMRKESALTDKQVFLDTIFNSSLQADIIVSVETGLITDCNKFARILFEVPEGASLSGRSARSLFATLHSSTADDFYTQMCTTENWKGDLLCVRLNGKVFPGSVNVVFFYYGETKYKKITISDITEKKQILDELKLAKKKAEESAAVKSRFLSHMSHELRTPLNGIIGSANLLFQEDHLPEQSEQLNILRSSSEHMLSLINEVLDLSKLDAEKIKLERIAVDVQKLAAKVGAPFIRQFKDKDLLFETVIDPAISQKVLADPTRLNQVLTNLLSNALKFTASGRVVFSIKQLEAGVDSLQLEFSVSDTGIGIPESIKQAIFDPFTQADTETTRKFGGTGLGLTISNKITVLMGSHLQVESKPNEGSRFFFILKLPVYQEKNKTAIVRSLPPVLEPIPGLKVLVAEDNPVNMLIATRFLAKWKVDFIKAGNGAEVLSLYEEKEHAFDLVLMDLEMPVMDGYEAVMAIRKKNKNIPVLALTAAFFENMKVKLLDAGFNDYIQKPFRPEDLHHKLKQYAPLKNVSAKKPA
jgi:signal transduction histidine kinase/CheY-like chemotaxis protein